MVTFRNGHSGLFTGRTAVTADRGHGGYGMQSPDTTPVDATTSRKGRESARRSMSLWHACDSVGTARETTS
jgi:hypothetical protein